ncbi:solute carrier family 66 member 3-like [Asterias amurensis]|uniref:solute carrier family 66 member 3-like n=1 Tax=Asterias amurensis TaxID=7602 RepID=UPI003AB7AC09
MAAAMEPEMLTSALFILNLFSIVPCVVMKIPQVWTLYTLKTARGISFTSIFLELLSHTVFMMYMFVLAKPLMQYAEYIFLVTQEWVVILLILNYSDQLDIRVIALSSLYFLSTTIIGGDLTPRWFPTFLLALSTPISVCSAMFQIVAIYQSKDSGSVSFLSWFIAWATGFARILTSFLTGEFVVLASYVPTNILRVIGCATILYYRPSPKKFR